MSLVLLMIYIVIFVFLLVNYIKCLKSKVKWGRLFIFEILSIILSIILLFYYDNLPDDGFMPGLTNIGEILFSFGAIILYGITFTTTLITKLVLYLIEKKKQGKNYFPIIALVIALILFGYGINTLILDVNNDANAVKTTATIIGYKENIHEYRKPIVEYSVNNNTYTAIVEVSTEESRNSNINDSIEIHYKKSNPAELAYLSGYEVVYVPSFIISVLLFIIISIKHKKDK